MKNFFGLGNTFFSKINNSTFSQPEFPKIWAFKTIIVWKIPQFTQHTIQCKLKFKLYTRTGYSVHFYAPTSPEKKSFIGAAVVFTAAIWHNTAAVDVKRYLYHDSRTYDCTHCFSL